MEKEPSSKPMTTLSVSSTALEASMAIDIGRRAVSVSPDSSVDASSSLSFLEFHARSPDIESAA
jgi:hypothetical protein